MNGYKHIFFDLDRTLWDFDENLRITFLELFDKYRLSSFFKDNDHFLQVFKKHNNRLWAAYQRNDIKKEVLRSKRFILTLEDVGLKDIALANQIGHEYLEKCPVKTSVVSHTYDVLGYLEKKYTLHVLTNGFRETQVKKIFNCNLGKYFSTIITSDEIGYQKPHAAIFNYALKKAGADKETSVMVGDNYDTDIYGAMQAGIDQVFFMRKDTGRNEQATFRINSLLELKDIL